MGQPLLDEPEVFIGRQPIFDRRKRVVAYEILFRESQKNQADVTDGEAATASVMLNSLTEIGLERIVGSHFMWINVTRQTLLDGIGLMLPADLVGFEIRGQEPIDAEVIAAVKDLKHRGYKISLDDFEYGPELEALLPLADIVKLDYLALGQYRFEEQLRMLTGQRADVLVERVETNEVYSHCLELDCSLFQGYFFQKPEILRERRIEVGAGSIMQVIAAMQDRDLQFDTLEPLIARDLALSARLLRYINSAFFGLPRQVASIRQALVLLGMENVRRWTTLTVMSSIPGKTTELTTSALIRARFCELAGEAVGLDGPEMFTVGLFSLIDAMLDAPLESILEELPFPEEMRAALLTFEGPIGEILHGATMLDSGYAADADILVENAGQIYLQALLWAQEASGALNDAAV